MLTPSVLIRADGSDKLGYGHIQRCMTLAEHLRSLGASVEFATVDNSGKFRSRIEQQGYRVHDLNSIEDPLPSRIKDMDRFNWLIIDHYHLGYEWQKNNAGTQLKIMVIDDLADRQHHCHYLLNQTLDIRPDQYRGLVSNDTTLLLGGDFALLRPEFHTVKNEKPQPNFENPKIHVFFGSTDPLDNVFRFSNLLLASFDHVTLKVVTGLQENSRLNELKQKFGLRIDLYGYVENMARNMADCDIAFGAPGMATWERGVLGLPGVYIATQPNQVKILNHLQRTGVCHFLGEPETLSDDSFVEKFGKILAEKSDLAHMAQSLFNKIDGLGAKRTSDIIMGATC